MLMLPAAVFNAALEPTVLRTPAAAVGEFVWIQLKLVYAAGNLACVPLLEKNACLNIDDRGMPKMRSETM